MAALTPERRSEIARLGGLAAQAKGTAHRFSPEKAREAGRKGGLVTSSDRAHMSRISRKGAAIRAAGRETVAECDPDDESPR